MRMKEVVITLKECDIKEILEVALEENEKKALKILKKLSKELEKHLKEK